MHAEFPKRAGERSVQVLVDIVESTWLDGPTRQLKMNTKINEALKKQLAQIKGADTDKGIPVIAILREGTDLSKLKQKGFKIQHFIESIHAVSMTLTEDEIRELEKMDYIELIEFDGAGVWPL